MMVTAPPLWSYGPGPSSLLIKDANMTDTTASSDAKQSQPAASLSGSELDRLRELAEQATDEAPWKHTDEQWCGIAHFVRVDNGTPMGGAQIANAIVREQADYIAAASPDVILALLAELDAARQATGDAFGKGEKAVMALMGKRQQDRQRIADLEDVLWAFGTNRDGLWDYRRATDLEHPTIKAMARLLKDYHPSILQERQSATPRLADAQGKEGE